MKSLATCLLAAAVLLLFAGERAYGGGSGIKALTSQYQPAEWQLAPVYPNPMSSWLQTELGVPVKARLNIAVYTAYSTRMLVRQIADSANGPFWSARGAVQWL